MNDNRAGYARLRLFLPRGDDESSSAWDAATDELRAAARRFQGVAAVIFDMDDVLYDAASWRRELLQMLRRVGLHGGYRSLFDLWQRDYLDAVCRGEHDFAAAFVAFLRDSGLTAGQSDEIVAAAQQIRKRLESESRLFPRVAETLKRLCAQGLKLGVVGNTEASSDALRVRLQQFVVGEHFVCAVSSVELRQTMPHPATYRAVLARLGVAPTETVFVGHDAEILCGARRSGMRTVAFNYDRRTSADCRIGCFGDLAILCGRYDDGSLSKAA